METDLDLMGRASDRHYVRAVLERFLGFHLVWEGAIRRSPALRDFQAPRTRIPHLRRDLAALGLTNSEMQALPLCDAASALVADPVAGVGSIYVLEGSTLGGQVIGRTIADTDWTPPSGLAYFTPYGARTGEMWRAFGQWAEARAPERAQATVVAGARRTFELLNDWLVR